ncbi:MAG: asparaginase [Betaproteobacteria bacterium]|nr:MAG: asparaginase [Betaproteobacteria bacterium]
MTSSSLLPSVTLPNHVPIAHTTRGGFVENVFYGSVAVVDRDGTLIASAGDVTSPIFTRSALKPFQALPFVAHPKFAEFGLTLAETALLCSSHNGEAMHADAAKAMLARIGLTDAALQCGSHAPYWFQANDKRPEEGKRWNSYFHNCSGKHSGMLLFAKLLAADNANYLNSDHAVQLAIRDAVAYACGVSEASAMPWGTDGCSAPNYAVSLTGLAKAFAWTTRSTSDPRFGDAGARLFKAMSTHPEMVSGEGRNDLALARAGRGDWIAKVGADGVQTLASLSKGIGIAAKVSDGNQKALMVAYCDVLKQLGMLDSQAADALETWINVPIKSIRGVEVGRYEPNVRLQAH